MATTKTKSKKSTSTGAKSKKKKAAKKSPSILEQAGKAVTEIIAGATDAAGALTGGGRKKASSPKGQPRDVAPAAGMYSAKPKKK